MSVRIVCPKSIIGGFYYKIWKFTFAIWGHTLQCDQRWLFMIKYFGGRYKRIMRFGYRTRGDASLDTMTYHDGGWHWPWKWRNVSGRS